MTTRLKIVLTKTLLQRAITREPPQSVDGKGMNALVVEVPVLQTEAADVSSGCRSWVVQFASRHFCMACPNSELVQKQLESVLCQDAMRTVRAPEGENNSRVDVRGGLATSRFRR